MTDSRLPAHIEVSALLRQTQVEGGFAVVIKKGEPQAGTILVVLTENGANTRVFERMPQLDGSRKWHCAKVQTPENPYEFSEYLERRQHQDDDLWIIELDVANGERLIGLTSSET